MNNNERKLHISQILSVVKCVTEEENKLQQKW